ncbi:hypothetical protein BKH42_03405 [Helicobacter sp. 13S00482-2]|uniref:penicillin-binding protein activator LpoB n=1 Tax=Helicobacter sp. 13S00482-2 TaxID=1476200 RepID=UPI000BA50260|nr:hypothetical protein [Helicobacter sp. 13S00482-2]PAF54024.1 hypothetical protein BKH42_03405 [Helicobacter sp. 13S00482-2]
MKNHHTILFVVFLVLFIGCSKSPTYVSDSKKYVSFDIDYHDIENVVNKNTTFLLKSKFVKNQKDKKIIAISDIVNDTDDDIDVELLSRKLASKIRQSDYFIITNAISGSGLTTDYLIKNSRKLRSDDEFNQKQIIQKGNLLAPDYSLSGKISKKIRNIGKKERVDYVFLLTLTDIKTGLILWDNEMLISKIIDKDRLNEYTNTLQKTDAINQPNQEKKEISNHFIVGIETRLLSFGSMQTPRVSLAPYGYGNNINYDHTPVGSFDLKIGYMLSLHKTLSFQFNALYSYSSSEEKDPYISYYYSDYKDPLKDIGYCSSFNKECIFSATSHKLGGEIVAIYTPFGKRVSDGGFYFSAGLLKDISSKVKYKIKDIYIERKFDAYYPALGIGIIGFYGNVGWSVGTKIEWSTEEENYFSQGWSIFALGLFLKI